MTGVLFVAKLQTATPDMFGFPVSVMILVMIVFGGIGSVWGVVAGAVILQLLQSWWLPDLTTWLNALGRLVGSHWLQTIDLVPSIELIFGIILVLTMLYRRQGLIPAYASAVGAELRAAARRGAARLLRAAPDRPGRRGGGRRGPGGARRHGEIRWARRAECGRYRRARRAAWSR